MGKVGRSGAPSVSAGKQKSGGKNGGGKQKGGKHGGKHKEASVKGDAKKAMKLSLAKKKAKADASAKKRSQQNEPQVSTGNAIFDEDDQLPDTRELDEEFFEEHGDYASFLSSLEVGSFTDGSTGPTCC